jgi:putative endonuclease
MAYYVYIVECVDGTLYTGSTNDVEKRLKAHNSVKSGAKYTRSRQPVALKYFKKYRTKNKALKDEYALKQLSRKGKKAIIKNNDVQFKT